MKHSGRRPVRLARPRPGVAAGNCFFAPYETIQSRDKDRPHPASYPSRLAEMCFKLHGVSRIRRTLDPFSGLGSTARAAKGLGLAHVGIELSAADNDDARRLLVQDAFREGENA